MEFHLPNSAFLGNIEGFIRKLDLSNKDTLHYTFNKRWISAHPMVLAMAACLGQLAKNKDIPIIGEVPNVRSLPYIIRMGLFPKIGLTPPTTIVEHESAGRFIPLTQIRTSNDLHAFITEMIPLLHADPGEADPIKYVISELVRNVLEHSGSPVGAYVCAQYFKDTHRVAIGVADAGSGILETMRVSHPVLDSLDAIVQALKPGITGTTRRIGGTESNAGAGLFFTRNIAKASKNHFVIYSGSGLYKLLKNKNVEKLILHGDPMMDRSSRHNDLPFWQGTAIGIDISTQPRGSFAELLTEIRKIYTSDSNQQKKQYFKKARFI